MKISPQKKIFYLFLGILVIGAVFRLYELADKSFKMCDEGYHLIYPFAYSLGDHDVFYFKHGMMIWIYLGLQLFSFSVSGALQFNACCGVLTLPLFYLLCRQFLNARASLFAAFAFATSYYITYYHRTFLSDGFGIFFFTATLLMVIISFRLFGVIKCTPGLSRFRKYKYPVLIATGALLGYSYTVRVQTCLTLCGCIGAFFAAFFLRTYIFRKRRTAFSFRRYFAVSIVLVLIGAFAYWVFLFHMIKDAVCWDATFEWYSKNFVIASGKNVQEWKPFMLIFLLKFCSLAFLAGAFTGLLFELCRVRTLNFVRLVVFISAAGLGCMYFYLKMPWPRAYLYFVYFLCIYWGICLDSLLSFKVMSSRKWITPLAAALALFSLFIGEFGLLKHMFTMDSNYNSVLRWIKENAGESKLSTTHIWPVLFIAAPRSKHIVYEKEYPSYEDFLNQLTGNCRYRDIRFVVLDNNVSYFRTNHDFLVRMYREFEPIAEFRDDYGLDEHTLYETYGRGPCSDVFIDKIVIFDIANMKKRPVPLKTEKK